MKQLTRIYPSVLTAGALLLAHASLAATADMSDWYPFNADQPLAESPIGLQDWQTEAAGTQGRIEMVGDQLLRAGQPIRLWGLNLTYMACAPEKELADRRAEWYRKIGINSVRLHKFADGGEWAGVMSDESILRFNPDKIDRMDYQIAALAEAGIYTKLSPNFGVKILPEDRARIPWFDEIGSERLRTRVGHGDVFLSEELQQIQIEIITKFLNRVNPYRGMRYADDPAIWCVEFYNEDSALFSSTINRIRTLPTLRTRNAARFSAWLLEKYGTAEAWRAAWGDEAIYGEGGFQSTSEHLRNLIDPDNVVGELPAEDPAAGTVAPWGQPWFYDAATRDTEAAALRQRMVDTMNFLIGLQDDFWQRLEEAIRATGYEGVILASNWQAGNNVSHFHNLYSDYKVGLIDRHNYFSGPRQAVRQSNVPVNPSAMVADPGSGMFSSGMQQVVDRPFMLSEWIHEQPSEWYAEGPAIIGAYGMGLNGWDVSYIFQNDDNAAFADHIGRTTWEVMLPQVAGTFPAIARQVRRGDVTESPVVVPLNVDPQALQEGVATASTFIRQRHDVKSFESDEVPNDAMAVARVAVDFGSGHDRTPPFDLAPHRDGRTLVSMTRQLRWTPAPEGQPLGGFFTINSQATVAFVGFADGTTEHRLGGFSIKPEAGFSTIYITALGPTETFASGGNLLLQAIARGRNVDARYLDNDSRIQSIGDGPLVMEPVRATIHLPAGADYRVEKLDHNGLPTGNFIPVEKNSFSIDGAIDQTPFYLIHR